MTLKELKQAIAGGTEFKAMVLAADPAVYVLQVCPRSETAQSWPVTLQSAAGRNLVFRSRYSADQAFARAGLTNVTLVHESAYGEIVGLDNGVNRMEQSYPVTLDCSRS